MKCRLWISSDTKMEDLDTIDNKYRNYSRVSVNATQVSCTDEQKKLKVDDLNFVDEDVFIVETQKDGKFVLEDINDEESKERIANEVAQMAEEA